jgi:hypothetical protein
MLLVLRLHVRLRPRNRVAAGIVFVLELSLGVVRRMGCAIPLLMFLGNFNMTVIATTHL